MHITAIVILRWEYEFAFYPRKNALTSFSRHYLMYTTIVLPPQKLLLRVSSLLLSLSSLCFILELIFRHPYILKGVRWVIKSSFVDQSINTKHEEGSHIKRLWVCQKGKEYSTYKGKTKIQQGVLKVLIPITPIEVYEI